MMRIFAALLAVCALFCISCAHHNESGFEPTVKVKGQYDAAFRVTR
jgi:hypothetical protein